MIVSLVCVCCVAGACYTLVTCTSTDSVDVDNLEETGAIGATGTPNEFQPLLVFLVISYLVESLNLRPAQFDNFNSSNEYILPFLPCKCSDFGIF